MRPRICVVGSSNMDLILRTPRLPKPGETLTATSLTTCPGGKGGNQAVMAARLGAQVMLVGKVGNDAFGEQLRRNYDAEGIDTSCLYTDDRTTGVATILVEDGGQNSIVVAPGANAALTARDVRKAARAIRSAEVLLCQFEVPLEATAEALRIAARGETQTILNPAPAQPLPADFPRCRHLVPNETEFRQLSGKACATPEALEKAVSEYWSDKGCNVIVTLGEEGVLAAFGPSVWRQQAIKVNAVDTSGAGDAFIGAFAVFLTRPLTIEQAIGRAMGVAALTVTRPGTQLSYPSLREATTFLRQHGLMNP